MSAVCNTMVNFESTGSVVVYFSISLTLLMCATGTSTKLDMVFKVFHDGFDVGGIGGWASFFSSEAPAPSFKPRRSPLSTPAWPQMFHACYTVPVFFLTYSYSRSSPHFFTK